MNNNEFFTSVIKGALNTENKELDLVPSEFQQNLFNQLNNFIDRNASTTSDDDADGDDDFVNQTVNCKYYGIRYEKFRCD